MKKWGVLAVAVWSLGSAADGPPADVKWDTWPTAAPYSCAHVIAPSESPLQAATAILVQDEAGARSLTLVLVSGETTTTFKSMRNDFGFFRLTPDGTSPNGHWDTTARLTGSSNYPSMARLEYWDPKGRPFSFACFLSSGGS